MKAVLGTREESLISSTHEIDSVTKSHPDPLILCKKCYTFVMKYGSAIIIKNNEGKILLQHRDSNAPTDKNKWAMWGGGKENNETAIETAIRELQEELDIEVLEDQLSLFKKFIVSIDGVNQKEVSVFILQDMGQFEYELHEGDELKFFAPEGIEDLSLDFVAAPVLSEYLGMFFKYVK